MVQRLGQVFLAILMSVAAGATHAVLTIEITKGLASGMPIAIVPFGGEDALPQALSGIIDADLTRSGRFNSIAKKDFLARPRSGDSIDYKDWRLIKAEALVIGSVQARGDKFAVEMQLHNVFTQERLVKVSFLVEKSLLRTVAHQISDIVYEKLTGERGAFNTRIAYISKEGPRRNATYKLLVADSDGVNARAIVVSQEPLMSPAWSPDATRLAYVSFEEQRSIVYIQNLVDGKRIKVAESKGINSAPAWSPDGTRLAVVLSKDGNPDIYVYHLGDRSLQRLTNNPAIDTEPAWAPSGRELVFTSDRGGRPQIYRMGADGSGARRVTFEGDYNARASFAPDGKSLTLVTGGRGEYHTAIFHLQDAALQVLTDTGLDESPTFAPNGRIILYATRVQGRGVLATVSADGLVRQVLKSSDGDIREPAWSPTAFPSQAKGVTQ